MANGRTTTWQRICSLLGAQAAASTDAQLLAHFIATREEAAFAELMRRHGPMAYGVCRRVLANAEDADDAYQATFLILARKPTAIRKADSLACWLHGVALRVSLRLKQQLRRRPDRAALPAEVAQAESDEVSWREVRRLLDEELARLPERFRQPLILCYLEGKTRDEAAEELGWSLSTFRGRLERGRERLRGRLERRGVALSAALLATLAAHKLKAAISATTVSARAAALATEVLRIMFLGQMKLAAWWCLAMLFLSVAVGGTAYHCIALEPGAPPKAAEPSKPVKPPTPPEEDGVVKDFKAHLDQFRLTITLRPQQLKDFDKRYPLSDLRLHVSSGPFAEPSGKGTAFAKITKEQAAKIINVLAKDNFFRDSVADWDRLKPPKGNYVVLWASYRIGDEPQSVKRLHALAWDLHMVEQLKAIRQCVDGEAAKALDKMLKSLEPERKHLEKSALMTIQAVEDLDALTVFRVRPDQRPVEPQLFPSEINRPVPLQRSEFDALRKNLDKQVLEAIRQAKYGPVGAELADRIKNNVQKMQEKLVSIVNDLQTSEYNEAKRHLNKLQESAKALDDPDVARYFLDGVLPFSAWPKGLTNEQQKIRDDGLRLAKTWLAKQTVEFHSTRAPHVGDLMRYTNGPTKVAREWKGQTPAELYAKDAFHINVLLIQEGYSPFVRSTKAQWDKKTVACYEAAEQYAVLHKKGIWKDPDFAERLKKIAEKATGNDETSFGPIQEWRAKGSIPLPEVLTSPSEFLAFAPDGKSLLASVRGQNALQLLDRNTLRKLSISYPQNSQCWPLGFTNDGEVWGLFMNPLEKAPNLPNSRTYRFVNLRTGKQLWSVDTLQQVREAVLSADGKYLAVTDRGNLAHLTLWNARTGAVVGAQDRVLENQLAELKERLSETQLNAFKREQLALKTTDKNEQGQLYREVAQLRLTMSELREQIDKLRTASVRLSSEKKKFVECVAFSPDGKTLAASCLESQKQPGEIRIWDTASGKTVATCQTPSVCTRLQYSRDGKRLFALLKRPPGTSPERGDSWVVSLNPANLNLKRVQFSAEEHRTATAFSVSPDGKLLAVAWDRSDKEKMEGKRVRIYDSDTGKELPSPDLDATVRMLAFSPDGKLLATKDENGRVSLWEAIR